MVIRAIDSEDMSANMEYSNDQISEILEMWKSDFERLLQNWSEKWKSKREQPEEPKEAAAPNHLYMEKTSSHQPTKVFDEMPESTLQSNYSDFLRTLVVTVHEASYPVTTETLHQIFDKYGLVEEIDILPSVGNFQALVRYKSMENSISARYSLHNRCMYEGCCWLDIKYLSYTFLEEVLGRHNWVEQIWSESETKLKVMYAAVKKVKVPCKLEPRPVNTLVSSIMRRESSVDVGVVYSIGEFEESSGDNFPNKTVTKELRELATEKLGSIGYVEILKEDQPVENQQLTIERASHISEWSIKEDEIDRDYDNAFLDHKSELIHILFDPGGGSGGKNEALEISGNDLTEHSMCGKPNSIIGQDGITQPIKTVVVLVLENRSFDHMLGWMKKSVNPSINGVTEKECNSVSKPSSDGLPQKICFSDDAEYVDPDPGHSFEAVEQQVFGSSSIPSMSGFVEQALSMSENLSETVMKGFKPQNVPIYATLVSEFAVFDRWFSSIPGPTQPSRLFVYSATSHGSTSHVKKQLATGCPQQTIFDSLHENGLDFGVYFQNIPTTLFYRNMRKLKYIFKFHQYDLKFKKDARKGKLPSLTVIEPRYFDLKGLPANGEVDILYLLLGSCTQPTPPRVGYDFEDFIFKVFWVTGAEYSGVRKSCFTVLRKQSSHLYGDGKNEAQELTLHSLLVLFQSTNGVVQNFTTNTLLRINLNRSIIGRALDSNLNQRADSMGLARGKYQLNGLIKQPKRPPPPPEPPPAE